MNRLRTGTALLAILLFTGGLYASIDIYIDRVEPEKFSPTSGESCMIWMTITEDATRIDIEIRDFQNNVIHSRMLTNRLRGAHSYEWNGLDAAKKPLPPGDYRIEAIARDASGERSSDFQYVTIIDEKRISVQASEIPDLPDLQPPALRPSGYLRSVGRYSDGEDAFFEHRAQLQFDYNKENLKVFARGDLRRRPTATGRTTTPNSA